MPTIITRGLGYDEPTIIQKIISSRLIGTVVAEARILGTVRVKDDAPVGQVRAAPIAVYGMVEIKSTLTGVVSDSQTIIGYLVEEGPLMSSESNRVVMFLRDDRTLSVTANYEDGSAADLTGAKMWFTVKEKASDPDTAALIEKRNTAAGGSDSEIKITNPTGGAAEVYIVPDDTDEINPGIYSYDVQVMLASGKTYTIVRDRITFKEDVTKAKS
jgi:hypothetical protein